MVLIDKSSAAGFLRSTIPEWAWLISKVESQDGRLRFPPVVARAITNLKIESYPLLYENEAAISLAVFRSFLSQDEIVELNSKLAGQSPEERGQTAASRIERNRGEGRNVLDLSRFRHA